MRVSTRPAARSAALLTATGLATVLALSGCSTLFGPDEPERDEETGEIVAASDASAFALRVGDCLDAKDLEEEVMTVAAKPCGEAHDSEVYAETELPAGDYPQDVETIADDFCLGEFEGFVGTAFDDSVLGYTLLFPTDQSWKLQDDRTVTCILVDEEGGLTESLKGSKR